MPADELGRGLDAGENLCVRGAHDNDAISHHNATMENMEIRKALGLGTWGASALHMNQGTAANLAGLAEGARIRQSVTQEHPWAIIGGFTYAATMRVVSYMKRRTSVCVIGWMRQLRWLILRGQGSGVLGGRSKGEG